MTEYTFLSANGKNRARACKWSPEGEVRAVVQLAHGIAEHIERYSHFAEFLASRGFLVVGHDHLGHGKTAASEDEYGFFGETAGWEMAVADLRTLHGMTSKEHPGRPYYMLGHSMGSFLARTYIIKFPGILDGVILSGTGQQPRALVEAGIFFANMEIRRHGAGYRSNALNSLAFGNYNKRFDIVRTVSDWISTDEKVVDDYISDPACGFIPSAGMFRDMMGGIRFVTRPGNLRRMDKNLPVLFFSGDKDPVGENGRGVMRAYQSFLEAGMRDVSLKLYPGGRHEMLNERNKTEVYNDILAWLDNKLAAREDNQG